MPSIQAIRVFFFLFSSVSSVNFCSSVLLIRSCCILLLLTYSAIWPLCHSRNPRTCSDWAKTISFCSTFADDLLYLHSAFRGSFISPQYECLTVAPRWSKRICTRGGAALCVSELIWLVIVLVQNFLRLSKLALWRVAHHGVEGNSKCRSQSLLVDMCGLIGIAFRTFGSCHPVALSKRVCMR